MICGIVSLVLSFNIIGLGAGITGLIMGIIARRQIRERPWEKGDKMALAGIICACIGIGIYVVILIVIIVIIGTMFAALGALSGV